MNKIKIHPRRILWIVVPLTVFALLSGIAKTVSALPNTAGQLAEPVASAPLAAPELGPTGPTNWNPDCTPVEVAVYEDRLHIRCSQGVVDGGSTIYYWAIPATKAQYANRFLSLGSTALVAGRHLAFLYTPGDTSGAAFGCMAADCRNVYSIILK